MVNEYWHWSEATDWTLRVRPYSRAELDAIERAWAHEAGRS